MFPSIDFDRTAPVSEYVRARYRSLFPGEDDGWLQRVFDDVDAMFSGRSPDYSPIDLKYHNLRHSLMATVCMAQILEGHQLAGAAPRIGRRDFELAIASVLLHDSGYLKLKSDRRGTGAKYTYCHILRSCAFAAAYLPAVGANADEVENVVTAINCTGPGSEIARLRFRDDVGRLIGCALATADYLGQLSDPDYPKKLVHLYAEFEESDDFAHVPQERRSFHSAADLEARTPEFWRQFVRPKLDSEFQGTYRMLERPIGSGRNGYLDAVEANFVTINRHVAATSQTAP